VAHDVTGPNLGAGSACGFKARCRLSRRAFPADDRNRPLFFRAQSGGNNRLAARKRVKSVTWLYERALGFIILLLFIWCSCRRVQSAGIFDSGTIGMAPNLSPAYEHIRQMETRIDRQKQEIERLWQQGDDTSAAVVRLALMNRALEEMQHQLGSLTLSERDAKRPTNATSGKKPNDS
jgi:hypothetical protein